jgi:hypothetical protein
MKMVRNSNKYRDWLLFVLIGIIILLAVLVILDRMPRKNNAERTYGDSVLQSPQFQLYTAGPFPGDEDWCDAPCRWPGGIHHSCEDWDGEDGPPGLVPEDWDVCEECTLVDACGCPVEGEGIVTVQIECYNFPPGTVFV